MNEREILKSILYELNPRSLKDHNAIFNCFFLEGIFKSNFVGGGGSERTTHEKLFAIMNPHLFEQVTFGTGKGGFEMYISKKYTVDFLDIKNDIVYEIDGKNHKEELQMLKDEMKEIFLLHEHGLKTIRYTNEEVELMALERIIKNKGVLDE